jgi:hypothetical protein
MRHAVLVAVLLGAVAAAEAQQSDKAVAIDPGSAPTAQYVWIALRGANAVDIRLPTGAFQRILATGPSYSFSQPWDVVSVPSRRLVFVSNFGNGTVTVLDSDSLGQVQVVNVGGTSLKGMSVSADESAVFVAGADANGPAVFRIDTGSLSAVRIGGRADATHVAEDCVVIQAANAGGAGSGPGKVYFSVRTTTLATPYIGVINLIQGTTTFLPVGAGALNEVDQPTNLERTPDHRFVFAGCTKRTGFSVTPRIIRIDASNDAASQPGFNTAIQDLAHRVIDVTWRSDAGTGASRGYVLASIDSGTPSIYEILDTGLTQGVGVVSASTGGVTPATIRFAPLSEQIFVGEVFGTSNSFNIFSAKAPPPVQPRTPSPTQAASGNDPVNFAVITAPIPVVSDMCPRGALAATPNLPVTVYGAGFVQGITFGLGASAVPATFVNSNTIIVNQAGATSATLGLTVTNPNGQVGTLDLFYRRFTALAPRTFTVALPSASQGYAMVSVPQYASITSLKAAFTAALGNYNPVLYRVFFYRGGRYVELNALPDDGCDLAGESFWVITRNGAVLTMGDSDVRDADGGAAAVDSRVIPINPGFSMISLPMQNGTMNGGSIPLAAIRVTTDQTTFTGAPPFPDVVMNPNVVEFVNGAYVQATALVAGRGYWVENISGSPAYLIFPPGVITKPAAPSGTSPAPATGISPPPPPGAALGSSSSSSSGCGLVGLEGLLVVLLVRSRRRR